MNFSFQKRSAGLFLFLGRKFSDDNGMFAHLVGIACEFGYESKQDTQSKISSVKGNCRRRILPGKQNNIYTCKSWIVGGLRVMLTGSRT